MTRNPSLPLWLFAVILCLGAASPASAHLTPNSEVRLDVREATVLADIIVPRGEYAYGTDKPIDNSTASLKIAHDYLLSNFSVSTASGESWQISIPQTEFVQIEGPPDLHAVAVLTPPPGGSIDDFTIDWHVLIDELPNHFTLFVLGKAGDSEHRAILGAMRNGSLPLEVSVKQPSILDTLLSAARVGAHHIMGGYDHLIFLLALLLPAPLLAHAGRWGEPRPIGDTAGKLMRIVTAFTVGHSLTLIGATLGGWQLPVVPVEVAIAVSVLASAIHAYRPILPGREPLVALLFGLIHGLAFATLVQEAGADMASSGVSLLGFNLGIELVQLAIVAAVAPSLLVLSRYPGYAWLRQSLALVCAAAALGWIVNRTTGAGGEFVEAIEGAFKVLSIPLIVALAALTTILLLRGHMAKSGKTPSAPAYPNSC